MGKRNKSIINFDFVDVKIVDNSEALISFIDEMN